MHWWCTGTRKLHQMHESSSLKLWLVICNYEVIFSSTFWTFNKICYWCLIRYEVHVTDEASLLYYWSFGFKLQFEFKLLVAYQSSAWVDTFSKCVSFEVNSELNFGFFGHEMFCPSSQTLCYHVLKTSLSSMFYILKSLTYCLPGILYNIIFFH